MPEALLLSSFDELLAMDLDGIIIATPSVFHAAQSIAALERGFRAALTTCSASVALRATGLWQNTVVIAGACRLVLNPTRNISDPPLAIRPR